MPIHITIIGENAAEVLTHIGDLAKGNNLPTVSTAAATVVAAATEAKAEDKKPKKEKAKVEEKVETPKAEVLPPEKAQYVLQDALARATEIADDGKNEVIMLALKAINTSLGISRVRELPADKVDSYMAELDKKFPRTVAAENPVAGMFD